MSEGSTKAEIRQAVGRTKLEIVAARAAAGKPMRADEREAYLAGVAGVRRPAPPPAAADYDVRSGDAPAPKRSRTHIRPAIDRASELARGQWFIWTDAPRVNLSHLSKRVSDECGFRVLVYRTDGGKVIVRRPAEGEPT